MCFDLGSQHLFGCWSQNTFRTQNKKFYATLYLYYRHMCVLCLRALMNNAYVQSYYVIAPCFKISQNLI